jgi:hypothetical protein
MIPPTLEGQAASAKELSSRVRRILDDRFDSSKAIETLENATDGDMYVFGGAVRRALFGDKLSGDVDIMVPNGDSRAFDELARLKVRFTLNSNNHHRYRWNSLQIDLFQPEEFFDGFDNVEAVLRFFDLKINALSLHLRSARILDPFGLVSKASITDPGINWARWSRMSFENVAVLAIRLTKIMHELPNLSISKEDTTRLLTNVIPTIRKADWMKLQMRYPAGKDAFLRLFEALIARRHKEGTSEPSHENPKLPFEALNGG